MEWAKEKPTEPGVYFCSERKRFDCDNFPISLDLAIAIVRRGGDGRLWATILWEGTERPPLLVEKITHVRLWAGPIPLPKEKKIA